MRTTLLLIGAVVAASLTRLTAGTVSLLPAEVTALRALIATNPAAAKESDAEHRWADKALAATPNPIQTVLTEGHLDNDPKKVRTVASLADMGKMEALGWTWAATGEARYAQKAREFILAWAQVNRPNGDAIDETQFESLITVYDLLRDTDTFSAADRQAVDAWLREKATVLWKDRRGLDANWYSHRLKIVGLIGWTIHDQTLIDEAVKGYHHQINANLKADGASTDFYRRDALHYHIYDIEPLLTLARTAERNDVHLFAERGTNGATLQSGVDFVIPFANGTKTHVEFVNSTVSFDRKRAANGQGEYAPHPWKAHSAIRMFSLAAWFRPEYGTMVAELSGRPGDAFVNWQMVLNAVSRPAGR